MKSLTIATIILVICCGIFIINPQMIYPPVPNSGDRYNFSNNGIITALLTSEYTLFRQIDPDEVPIYFSGMDTIYLQMENDGILFIPERTSGGTAEYKVYSEISETYAVGLMSISEARTFAYWVLTYPPSDEDTSYINQYYFSIINEKILE